MDAFETLSFPRQAALDEEALRAAYARVSREAHPDHGGSENRAAEVNASYELLRAPEKRLKHLLELDGPEEARAWRAVPMDDGMMNVFLELGSALESSGKLLAKKEKAASALAKALLANEEMAQRERLEAIGFALEDRRRVLEEELAGLDAKLAGRSLDAWKDAAAMQARFSYIAKWHTQVRERLLALM